MKTRVLQKTKGGVHYVNLPDDYRKEFGWEKGDIIVVRKGVETLYLRRMRDDPNETPL